MKMTRKVKHVVFHTGVQIKHIVVNSMEFKDKKTNCELYEHPHGIRAIEADGTEHILPVGSVVKQYVLMPREQGDE